jgi:hypothetical protein
MNADYIPSMYMVHIELQYVDGDKNKRIFDTFNVSYVIKEFVDSMVQGRIQNIKDNSFDSDLKPRIFTKCLVNVKRFILDYEYGDTIVY